jgi:hypothetical protein
MKRPTRAFGPSRSASGEVRCDVGVKRRPADRPTPVGGLDELGVGTYDEDGLAARATATKRLD